MVESRLKKVENAERYWAAMQNIIVNKQRVNNQVKNGLCI